MAAVSAVLIPADVDEPVRRITVDGLDGLQAAVGGSIEAVDTATLGDQLTSYVNENGKYDGSEPNPRATTLMGPSLFAGDFIAGPLLICGFDPRTGENRDCPLGFEAEFLDIARRLPAADQTTRKPRRINYEWKLRHDADGKTHLAVLSIGHHTAGVSMLSGRVHGNEFYASLQNETAEDRNGFVVRGFKLGDGVLLYREPVSRYSDKGLDRFAAAALARLEDLYGQSNPQVTRYFATEVGASLGAVL